jgi:exodeoxyribonuclease VIII
MNGTLISPLPMADYLAIEALSSGACKSLATGSPYAWRNRTEPASPALSLGTLAHLCILEPERFAAAVVQPDFDARTNAGKEIMVEWLTAIVGEPTVRPPHKAAVGVVLDLYLSELRPRLAASGLTVITEEQRSICMGMRNAIMASAHTAALIDAEGVCEITGTVTDPEFGIPLKVRPDKLLSGQPIIVSLKTCQSVADRDYLRTAWTYGWHLSAAFYSRALEAITGEPHRYWELAVESAPPHDVLLLEYTEREITEGAAMMRRGMETYRRCTEAGIWPGAGWDWDLMDYTIRPIGRQETTL